MRDIVIGGVLVLIFILVSTFNYSVEYKKISYENLIEENTNKINELLMKGSQQLSRESAIEDYDLKLNLDNIYYLEEENGN